MRKKRSTQSSSSHLPPTSPSPNLSLNVQKKKNSFTLSLNISGLVLKKKRNNHRKQTRTPQNPSPRQKNNFTKILRHFIPFLSTISKHPLFQLTIIPFTILTMTNLTTWLVTTHPAKLLGIRFTSEQNILLLDKYLDVILRLLGK